jgi:hypothetical protein
MSNLNKVPRSYLYLVSSRMKVWGRIFNVTVGTAAGSRADRVATPRLLMRTFHQRVARDSDPR